MRRGLEAGYGSPQCPEVVGMAQTGLAELKTVVEVEPVVSADISDGPLEKDLLDGYRKAVGTDVELLTRLSQIQKVYDTGMVPAQHGVELGFDTVDGGFFNSVGPDITIAMRDGISYYLSNTKEGN